MGTMRNLKDIQQDPKRFLILDVDRGGIKMTDGNKINKQYEKHH